MTVQPRLLRRTTTTAIMSLLLAVAGAATAEELLHVRIDRLIAQGNIGPVAPRASDAEFLRRLSMDLTGTIPSSEAARAFLDDQSTDKRAVLIDRLLGSPWYVRHMAKSFDVILMERRGDKHVKSPEWQKFLQTSFEQNKPYNQLAREILGADGTDPKLRAAAKFYLDRDGETNLLTRDVGRIFFGMDLQCSQCHDHPLIDDYVQPDYYGIFAFLSRSFLFTVEKKKKPVFAEKAEGSVSFKSVFTDVSGQTRPRLPGSAQIDEPRFHKGDEYKVKPAKNVGPVPKYSRRAQLAKLATDGSNRAFNRNIVNRLWAHMMGRGLVHPADLHHSDNPPSHPKLLEILADEFVAMKFDIKVLLRELSLSETYQRSFQPSQDFDEHIAVSASRLPAALEAELQQFQQEIEQAVKQLGKAEEEIKAAEKTIAPVIEKLKKADEAVTKAKKPADEAAKALADAQKQLATKQDIAGALTVAAASAQEAAKKLPKDKELAQATEKFQSRAKKFSAEVATLKKTVAERSPKAQQTAEKLAVVQKAADAVAARLAEPGKPLAAGRKNAAEARTRLKAGQTAVKRTELRIEGAEALLAYRDLEAGITAVQASIEKTKSEIAAGKQTAEKSAQQLAQVKADVPAVEKANSAAVAVLTAVKKQLADEWDVIKLIVDAAAKTDQARQKLPDDADLGEVLEKLKARSAQLQKDSAETAKAVAERQAAAKQMAERLAQAKKNVEAATAELTAAQQTVQDLETKLQQASEKVEANRAAFDEAYDELSKQFARQFAVAPIEPLTPEQLAWSVIQASGLAAKQRAASAAEINKKNPLKPEDQKDAAKVAQREHEIEQAVYDKLKGNVGKFVNLFGSGAGQPQNDFFATVDQALFFANGSEIRGWLAPGGGNLTDRLLKLDDPQALVEEMYLSVLTRRPNKQEMADVAKYLSYRPKEKSAIVQEMVWALLTSTEFRFHH